MQNRVRITKSGTQITEMHKHVMHPSQDYSQEYPTLTSRLSQRPVQIMNEPTNVRARHKSRLMQNTAMESPISQESLVYSATIY